MGSCCSSEQPVVTVTSSPNSGAQTPENQETKSPNYNANKNKTFVIIGGGPAGLHMASILINKGYEKVYVIEKEGYNPNTVGKTMTILDETINNNINDYDGEKIVHELGTCYLHPEYFVIHNLIEKYDPENEELKIPSRALFFNKEKDGDKPIALNVDDNESKINKNRRIYDETFTFTEWIYSEAERLSYPKAFHWLPDLLTGSVAWLAAINRYIALHEEIFGKQKNNKEHGFLSQPKDMSLIDMTFLQFLEKNDLHAVIPTFVYSQSVQGYGTLDAIPAFYGLFWNTPELLTKLINFIRLVTQQPSVTCLSKGFGSLWQNLIKKLDINIKYNCNITNINRHLDDEKAKIEITMNNNGNNEIMECDFLFIASGMHKIIDHKHEFKNNILEDVTDIEKEIWLDMEGHTLAATLFEFDVTKETIEEAAGLMHPNKIWYADGALYARRNSAKCLLGEKKYKKLAEDGKIKRERAVGYQFLAREPQEGDKEMLSEKFEEGVKDMELENVKVIQQEVWEYFPTWTQNGINKGYPWKVKDELQGKFKNTFYIGCSVSYESVFNVAEYNNELDHNFQF